MPSQPGLKNRAVDPALYIGAIPRHATGNGFSTSTWAAIEDVHASAAPPILAALADAAIPAFANPVAAGRYPGADHRGHHQLVRLWVDAHEITRARLLVAGVTGRVRQ